MTTNQRRSKAYVKLTDAITKALKDEALSEELIQRIVNNVIYSFKGGIVYFPKIMDEPARKDRHRQVLKLYEEGKKMQEIAEMFNMQRETVRYILITQGVAKYKFKDTDRNLQIYKQAKQGESIESLSDKYGISTRWIWQIIKFYKRREAF